MERNTTSSRIYGLLALMLFLVFSVCIMGVLLSSAEAYQRLNERNRVSGDQRTSMMFVSTKVRQYDSAGVIGLDEVGGHDALKLTEEDDGDELMTLLYCHDGWLCELYTFAGVEPDAEDGEQIIEIKDMQLEMTDGLLHIVMTEPDGTVLEQRMLLRSGEGIK